MLFSILFTCLPVILLGAFDQDVDAKTSLLYPILYKRGIAGLEYTRTVFFSFVVDGLYQSVSGFFVALGQALQSLMQFQAICFFVPYLTYSISTTQSVTGVSTDGMAELGTVIAISAVLATNCLSCLWMSLIELLITDSAGYTAMLTRYWTKLFVIITALSSLSVILWTAIYSIFPFSLLGIVVQLFSTAPFYLTVIVTVIFCLLPRFAWMYTQGCYWPTEVDIIREKRLAGNPDDSGQRKAGDDLPSAIALPLSPPESATRTPSYFSSVPPPTGTPTGQTPETRSPLYSTFTPPQSLTPPMQQELWHSPSSQWDSPQENFSENTEERHRSSVYLSPDSSLSQRKFSQTRFSLH